MKKMYRLLLSAVCATMLFSCVKENFEEPQEKPIPDGYEMQEFTATSVETKTTIEVNDDGTHGSTLWAKDDQLSIFWDGGQGTADLEGEGGAKTGKFKGALPQGMRASHAVYPSSVTASVDGNTVKVAIPAEQNGTFSAGNIAVAEVGEGNSLAFNNVNAFLCVQLVSGDITKITIESVGGEAVVGTIPVTFGENGAECGAVENGSSKVTMTKNEGETGRYYVSIVPGVTHSEGLLMTYFKGEEVTGTYHLTKKLSPVANKIYNFGEFEPDYNYYVTKDGAGDKTGVTWSDAMPFSDMIDMLGKAKSDNNTLTAINGAVFNIAEGKYVLDDLFAFEYGSDDPIKLTFKGVKGKTSISGNKEHTIFDIYGNNEGNGGSLEIIFEGLGFVESKSEWPAFYCQYSNSTTKFVDCFVSDNESTGSRAGAGRGVAGIAVVDDANLILENTLFERNSGYSGPAVYAEGGVMMTGCTFSENVAKQDGGAVFAERDMEIKDCTFSGNSAKYGGAIYIHWKKTTVYGGVFEGNEASGNAGAISVGQTGELSVYDYQGASTVFSGNSASRYGGALEIESKAISRVNNAIFKGNSAQWGGAVALYGPEGKTATTYFNGCTFGGTEDGEGNHATTRGGAMYLEDESYANLVDCSLIGNHSVNNGGAICVEGWEKLCVFRSSFIGNYGASGGAIYTDSGTNGNYADLFIDECSFDANYITDRWGTTMNINGIDHFCMHNSSIRGSYNTTNQSGDKASWVAMDVVQEYTSISNCSIIGNTQYSSNGSSFTTINGAGLIALWGDQHYFTNNIIVPESDAVVSILGGGSDKIDLTYNHYNKLSGVTSTDNGGNVYGLTSDDIDALTWSNDDNDSYYWKWDGTINGSAPSFTNQLNVYNRVNELCLDFINWSGSDFYKDQRNVARGNGDWWPGAYQGNATPPVKVTVTTFNIRGSNNEETDASREWKNRKSGVFAWFNENQHPFVLTQECSEDQRNDILSNCSAYDVVYYAGSSSWWDQILGRDTDAPVVTFYKKDEVTIHNSGTFWLVEGAPTSPKKASNQNQERCATWMKCTYKGQKMVVINTHISYKTKDGATGDAEEMQALRESEIGVIKTWISNNYNREVDGPLVLAGDFNINQGNSVFDDYKNGSNGFYFAREEAVVTDTGRTFNNWGVANGQLTIDFQFYKGFSSVQSYSVDRDPYADVTYISDHWPLSVVYEF
jgi:predicted outer membrane repeat protein